MTIPFPQHQRTHPTTCSGKKTYRALSPTLMRTWTVSPYRRPVRPIHGNCVNRQELQEEVKVFASPPPSTKKRGALLSGIKPPPLWDHTDHLPTIAGNGGGPRNLHSLMCQLPQTTNRWSLGKKGKEPRMKEKEERGPGRLRGGQRESSLRQAPNPATRPPPAATMPGTYKSSTNGHSVKHF